MTYSDFTITTAEALLGVSVEPGDLFPGIQPARVPEWLVGLIQRGRRLALSSEKSRSEFLVAPVILAARESSGDAVAIYSGERLDVDPEAGLAGVCDFILALTPSLPRLKAPLITILEAKRHDIEGGLGQCIAQMVAAARFNQQTGGLHGPVFGCVTSGEIWQFLRLGASDVVVDRDRYYVDNLGLLLAVFQNIVETSMAGV